MRQLTEREEPITARGVLRKEEGSRAFRLQLFEPHAELKPWVEYYWAVEWDLGDRTFVQTVITNPTIDLSFEDDVATNGLGLCLVVTGVVPRSYHRILRGRAEAFAVHFHPGMFRPWWGTSVNALTGKAERLGSGNRAWETAALTLLTELMNAPNEERVRMLDALLLAHCPPRDVVSEDLRDLVHSARHDRALWDTPALARRRSVSLRTNQREFLDYVGVSPKWVTQRYRVQAAIDALDEERTGQGEHLDLTQLALDLGYYDLAHFSRDFRAVTGYSPDKYRRYGN
jgi:AraC-like DNA-binding protein